MTVVVSVSPSSKKTTKKQGRRRSNSLQPHVVEYLKKWLMCEEHINHPYPTEEEKKVMVADTGIDMKRLNNWFVNNRIRYWKPRFEALQAKQLKEMKQNNNEDLSTVDNSISSVQVPIQDEEEAPSSTEGVNPKVMTSMNIDVEICGSEEEDNTVTKTTTKTTTSRTHVVSPRVLDLSHLVQTFINDVSTTIIADDSTSSSSIVTGGEEDHHQENIDEGYDLISSFRFQHQRCNKRQRIENENDYYLDNATTSKTSTFETTPRFKYMRKNVEQWKLACVTSPKPDDKNLPTLDEAAHLFGYSSIVMA
jgi:hypothetical protein